MLTPAEELGLAGMNVASRVRGAFRKIDGVALAGMMERIRLESLKNHVVYLRDGRPDAINDRTKIRRSACCRPLQFFERGRNGPT